jgi:hypothetical protein
VDGRKKDEFRLCLRKKDESWAEKELIVPVLKGKTKPG